MIALIMGKRRWCNKGFAASLFAVLLVTSLRAAEVEYGLPVKLDSSTSEVRKVLGAPTEGWRKGETITLESYYSRGILGEFEHDRLFSIIRRATSHNPWACLNG